MKRLSIIIFLVLPLVITTGCNSPFHKNPCSINYPSSTFEIPKAERFTLDNGIIVYFMGDDELPLVNISAVIRTGSLYDPKEKEGLAEITGSVMRTGGTARMKGDEIDEELDYMAGSMSVSTGRESGTLSMSVLKEDLDKGMRIFSDILIHPVFEESKLKQVQELSIESLRRVYDNPQRLAFREFTRIIYAGNPRGRLSSISSINNINRSDLIHFHRQFFYPANIMIAVSGDIKKDKILTLLNKHLADWDITGNVQAVPPPVKQPEKSISYIFKDIPQSVIILGQIAPGKKDPDFFSFQVLDFILGSGGFNSRIFNEIRNNLGLAYSAGSFYSAHNDYGIFAAYAMTKSASTAKTLSVISSIIKDTQDINVKEDELAWAKQSIDSSFVFSFTSAEEIAIQQLMVDYNNLPDDFLSTYRRNIKEVTLEDVKKVALSYLPEETQSVLVVGNEANFDEPLSRFGKITKIEVKNGR
ncbi:MAG: insulinase family protein [Deltaproteobacteria bacterium]|nr:insulinase family protein [Deltaproteobacteria bacterium]